MEIQIEPGKYVVAVSGGVDSVVLLNVLSMQDNIALIVAHFDHGIRPESGEDANFVKELADGYGLPYELGKGNLGPNASEALARDYRYKFLHKVRAKYCAKAILTAHHQDDAIETAWINIMRGTKYRGIYSLRSRDTVVRPLINMTKQQILDYAQQNSLEWREDATNQQDVYLRNRIRKQKESNLTPAHRDNLLAMLARIEITGQEIEQLAGEVVTEIVDGKVMKRQAFILLPYGVSCEVLATFLRKNNIAFDRPTIERAVVDIKTKFPGKSLTLSGAGKLVIAKEQISLRVESSV